MAENNQKPPIITSPRPQNIPPRPQQQQQEQTNVLVAQAINNLSQRLGMVEIEASKANANIDVLDNRIELFKKTIDLLEKEMKFSFKEIKNEKG